MTLFALFGDECRLWSIFDGPYTRLRPRMGHFLVEIDDPALARTRTRTREKATTRKLRQQQEPGA